MALTAIPKTYIPDKYAHTIGFASGLLIDASGEQVSTVFALPKAGDITKLGMITGAVGGTPSLRSRLEGVASTGEPDGAAYGGCAYGNASPTTSTSSLFEITLGTPATVPSGDVGKWVHAPFSFNGFSAGQSVNFLPESSSQSSEFWALPGLWHNTGSWTRTNRRSPLLVGYSDGSYEYVGTLPFKSTTGLLYHIDSNPDEYGFRWYHPLTVRAAGVWWYGAPATSGYDCDIRAYSDPFGTPTLLDSKTFRADQVGVFGGSGGSFMEQLFPTRPTFNALTEYGVTLRSLGSFFNMRVQTALFDANAQMGGWPGGKEFYQISRNNLTGAFTPSDVTKFMGGLIIDAVDIPAGGGGGSVIVIED